MVYVVTFVALAVLLLLISISQTLIGKLRPQKLADGLGDLGSSSPGQSGSTEGGPSSLMSPPHAGNHGHHAAQDFGGHHGEFSGHGGDFGGHGH